MRWLQAHDMALMQEILVFEPWEYRHGSSERGNIWERISESLNSLKELQFQVNARSVRDRYKLLADKFKHKERDELNASDISPEVTDLDNALSDIVERFDQGDKDMKQKTDKKKAASEADAHKAEEIRKRSLETFSETDARNDLEKPKRQRNSGSDTLVYLREKGEREVKIKENEIELKKQENEIAKSQTAILQQSLTQQQQMLQIMLQNQQQQQGMMLSLLEKIVDK